MVDIQSKEVIDKISEDLKVQPAMQIPRALAEKIELVYVVNPERLVKIKGATASDATTATIITTSTTKDTFLIGAGIAVAKDVNSNSLISSIVATPSQSDAQTTLMIRYEPTTAGQFKQYISFPIPIKLERGTTVTITNTSATASIDTTGIIYFYEVDPQ